MSVNWSWQSKKGEIVWVKDDDPNKKLIWNIYQANCLAAFIKEWNEDGKDLYEFITFFSDLHHMKRCLGLEKNWNKQYDNCFNEIYANFNIEQIKLDIDYPDWEKMAKWFIYAGYKVELYSGKIKKKVDGDNSEIHNNRV